MQKDLRAAADTGCLQYKLGGHLKWAFEHLQSTGGIWRADGFNGWNGLTMPSGIVNFLENVEKRGTEVVSSYSQWQSTQMRIKEQARNARWDSLGTEMRYAQTAFENITPKSGAGSAVKMREPRGQHQSVESGWVTELPCTATRRSI